MRGEQIGHRGERDNERSKRPHLADSHRTGQDREIDDLEGLLAGYRPGWRKDAVSKVPRRVRKIWKRATGQLV